MRAASLALLCSALAGCAVLDNLTVAPPPDDPYVLVESLVTEAGPRFAGSEGNARAVRWAVRTMTELGFRNVHTEPVIVPDWERGSIEAAITAPVRADLVAVALGGSVATPRRGIDAEVVSVGSLEELQSLPDSRVRGRIVYFSGRTERTRDGTGYGKAVAARRSGPADAGRKGALAVLIRSIGTDSHRIAHTGMTQYKDAPRIPAAALSAPDADLLERVLARGPVTVHLEITSRERPPRQASNVIGEIPGQGSEIVLLTAHLDSWDITPGANDDGAGVGIVIAAARRIATAGTPLRTVRVALMANEEFGVSGSKEYARAHAGEMSRHVFGMEADSGSGPVYALNAGVAEVDWPWVEALAKDLGVEVGANGKAGGTDMEAMRKLGVPEVMARQDASSYFDVHHTIDDTVDKIDRAGIEQATRIFTRIAGAAANRPEGFGRLEAKPD